MPRYTLQGIVYSLYLAPAAQRDLSAIGKHDPDTENDLLVFLEAARTNQTLLDSLTVKDYGLARNAPYHVDKWIAQQKKGRNLWRLKLWDLEDLGIRYRIVYALESSKSRYHILAILARSVDYDEKHPRVRQLIADYDELGIPSY